MHLNLVTIVFMLVSFVAASPHSARQPTGIAIPITKRAHRNLVNPDRTVNFRVLEFHVASVNGKIFRGFWNYEKNMGRRHPFTPERVEKRSNRVFLTDEDCPVWYGAILVGTPAERFTVAFDTGSADLFLPGSNCNNCDDHDVWDPTSSITSEGLDEARTLEYGDGTVVSVDLYSDTVSIAGFTATSQTLGAAQSYPEQLQYDRSAADGYMGMAFESISTYKSRPLFQTLVSEGQVTTPMFSFWLEPSGGELFIGGENSALHTEDFTYVDVEEEGYWLVKMDNILADGELVLSNIPVIIDTGSSVITGSLAEVKQLYDVLEGIPVPSEDEGYYSREAFVAQTIFGAAETPAVPCGHFPEIGLTFGGRTFLIDSELLDLGRVSGDPDECLCGIVGNDPDDHERPFWIIGHLFLETVYTTFNVETRQVGFAPLARE